MDDLHVDHRARKARVGAGASWSYVDWETQPFGSAVTEGVDSPHFMVTEGVRNADGTVRTVDGEIYQPMKSGSGVTDRDDREVHLTFHDAPGPEATNNFPPPLDFFYHVQFEVVDIRIDGRS